MKKPNISTKPRCANTGTSAGGCGKRLAVVSPKTIDCTRPKMAANATPSASSKMGVAQGCCFMAVVKIRNSLAKTPKGGVPRMASVPIINPQPTVRSECQQQNGRRPGLLFHGRRQNKKFTRKDPKGRRAKNGERAHHQSPADGQIGVPAAKWASPRAVVSWPSSK